MKVTALSWRQFRREYRSGELRALAGALVIAVAALTAVNAFSERVEAGLRRSANELLGGDLVIASRNPLPEAWAGEARERELAVAETVEFPTVAFAADRSLLVQVKAVSAGYPLRGTLTIADEPAAAARPARRAPQTDEAWVDPRVLGELALAPGDEIELGERRYRIGGIIRLEPDRSGVFNLAPRVMIPQAGLGETGLLGEGSRARYHLLVAGPGDAVASFRQWLEPRRAGAHFQTLEESQQQISRSLDRAERFLSLAALSAVLLAGIALVIGVREFARRHQDTVAILRCLGASQTESLLMLSLELLWMALPAIGLGILIGYGTQHVLVWAMGDLVPEALPLPGPAGAVAGVATGLLALFGFGLPPLIRLRRVPPARVLKRQTDAAQARDWLIYLLPAALSIVLIFWQAGDFRLGGLVTLGLIGTLLALAAAAAIAVIGLRRLRGVAGVGWRYGLSNLARRRGGSLLQIAGLGLGAMMIFLLSVVQSDLLSSWRGSLPERTPNFFLINIQPDQVAGVRRILRQQELESEGVFPMAVARIETINGGTPQAEGRGARRVSGTVNLSWAEELPPANRIVAGRWWSEEHLAEVSLADSWARSVGVWVGDRITFRIGAQRIETEVTSIREVDWDSFEVNFFIQLSPESVGDVPATYISSVYVPEGRFEVISEVVRAHPNISVIDVGTILRRVRTIIERVSLTVRVVFVFTVAAGVLVLLAALRAGLGRRIYEGAVLRTLGAARAQLRRAVLAEFGLIGALAGTLAAVAAQVTGLAIANRIFEIPYQASWSLVPLGCALGAVFIAGVGLWGSRRVLTTPPVTVLRREP